MGQPHTYIRSALKFTVEEVKVRQEVVESYPGGSYVTWYIQFVYGCLLPLVLLLEPLVASVDRTVSPFLSGIHKAVVIPAKKQDAKGRLTVPALVESSKKCARNVLGCLGSECAGVTDQIVDYVLPEKEEAQNAKANKQGCLLDVVDKAKRRTFRRASDAYSSAKACSSTSGKSILGVDIISMIESGFAYCVRAYCSAVETMLELLDWSKSLVCSSVSQVYSLRDKYVPFLNVCRIRGACSKALGALRSQTILLLTMILNLVEQGRERRQPRSRSPGSPPRDEKLVQELSSVLKSNKAAKKKKGQ